MCSPKKLCGNTSCNECFNKSFASHEKAAYLSKNNTTDPRSVFKSSAHYLIFSCGQSGHPDFPATTNNVSRGKWCKPCGHLTSQKKQQTPQTEVIKQFVEKHGLTYDYSKVITNGVDRPVNVICRIHGEFHVTPWNHISSATGGCEHCAIIYRGERNRYTFDEFCEMANKVHFRVGYDYSVGREEYKTLKGEEITIICKIHGPFKQLPSVHLMGCGCPFCKNKTEGILKSFLEKLFQDVVHQFKLENCKNPDTGRNLKFDSEIGSIKTIVELDGRQHFTQVSNWGDPKESLKRDIYKMQRAEAEGYKIIRIFQEDVYNNDEKWLEENLLPHIKSEDRNPAFISNNPNMYDDHKELYSRKIEIMLGEDSTSS